MKKLLFIFMFMCVPSFLLAAEAPGWIKSGKSAKFPLNEYVTAVGSGEDEKLAVSDSQKNMIQNMIDTLASFGIQKAKLHIEPLIIKSFEKGLVYNDREAKVIYVLGVMNKNIALVNIDNDLFNSEEELQNKSAILERSNFSVIPKIKAINEILDLYERRDSITALKKTLMGSSIISAEERSFEREKLGIERKRLFENVAYYIYTEGFDAKKLKQYLVENEFDIVPELPEKATSSDKGIIMISCRITTNEISGNEDSVSYWVADLVLSDAYNENTVLYSNTSSSYEVGKSGKDAKEKASLVAEIELNTIATGFFKGIVK